MIYGTLIAYYCEAVLFFCCILSVIAAVRFASVYRPSLISLLLNKLKFDDRFTTQ